MVEKERERVRVGKREGERERGGKKEITLQGLKDFLDQLTNTNRFCSNLKQFPGEFFVSFKLVLKAAKNCF